MNKNIPLRVRNLIKRHATHNPFQIAKDLKIEIMFGKTPSGINGLRKRILNRKYIFINEDLEEWQQKVVLCHELGHYQLKHCCTTYCMAHRTFFAKSFFENEADEFAIELFSYSSELEEVYVRLFLKEGWKFQNLLQAHLC